MVYCQMLMILAMTLGWKTVSVDWANAFIQSKLEEPILVHLPRGFSSTLGPNTCLKLKEPLYGTSIAPRLWWLHLREALLSIGMKESPHDQCLLYRPGLLMVLYVDDAGLAAPTMQGINHFVNYDRPELIASVLKGEVNGNGKESKFINNAFCDKFQLK